MKVTRSEIIQQIYEQTIVRAFENDVSAGQQLIDDSIDILLWLEVCVQIKEVTERIKFLKETEELFDKQKNKQKNVFLKPKRKK